MNPHQKPQEDVVGNAPKAADAIESLTRRVVFAKPTVLTNEHIAAFSAGQPVSGAVDEPKLIGALMGPDNAYARGYEAGRRDMREEAGKENAEAVSRLVLAYHAAICCPKGVVPDDELYDPDLAKTIQAAMDAGIPVRAVQPEPLGGEQP